MPLSSPELCIDCSSCMHTPRVHFNNRSRVPEEPKDPEEKKANRESLECRGRSDQPA